MWKWCMCSGCCSSQLKRFMIAMLHWMLNGHVFPLASEILLCHLFLQVYDLDLIYTGATFLPSSSAILKTCKTIKLTQHPPLSPAGDPHLAFSICCKLAACNLTPAADFICLWEQSYKAKLRQKKVTSQHIFLLLKGLDIHHMSSIVVKIKWFFNKVVGKLYVTYKFSSICMHILRKDNKYLFHTEWLLYLLIHLEQKVNLIKSKVGQELIHVKLLTLGWTLITQIYRMEPETLQWGDLGGNFYIHCLFQYSWKTHLLHHVATITAEHQTLTLTFWKCNLKSTKATREQEEQALLLP